MDRRRDIWLHHEIMALLSLLKEKQIADLMDSKRFRTTDIFKSLENAMNKKGIIRDAKQIQIKFKSLKQNYNSARRALSQSGTKVKCPYFEELQEIFGHRPTSIQVGIDSINITQNEKSEMQSSNSINLDMYDNVPDPFDGAVPGTSHNVEVMHIKIKNASNVSTNVLDNIDDNSDNKDRGREIHKNINTTIDKTNNIDKNINIRSDNTNKVNNNNDNINKTKPKIEINNEKENLHTTTHPLRSEKRLSFSQTFDKCVDKIINSNAEQLKTVIESNNQMMILIMEKEKEMLQEQTQLLLQFNNNQSSTPYSFPAFNFPTNFVGQPRFQQFPKPSLQLQKISNQSPRFVKIPLSTVETARKTSSNLASPPLTPMSISTHVAEVPSSSSGDLQSNISTMAELNCDIENIED